MLGIDVLNSRELKASILGIRNADRDIQKNIRTYSKEITLAEWKEAVAANVTDRPQSVILANTAKVKVSNQNIRLSAGDAAKKVRKGGPSARDLAGATEFGADRSTVSTYTATRNGKQYHVRKRHTTRQFLPHRGNGYVVYPAAAATIPRIASLWVQTIIRTLLDAVEGK